jgi:photosystem II stability/assembly factor-like uncharacterized protein
MKPIIMKKILILIFFAFASLAVSAQNTNYTALLGPYGGNVTDIEANGAGALLATVNGSGVFKSTDGGLTWTASSNGITDFSLTDLERDAATGKIYLVSYSKIYYSTDDGTNWLVAMSIPNGGGRKIRKSPASSTLYLITNSSPSKIYRSNGASLGTTWLENYALPSGIANDMIIGSNGYIYVASSAGIYLSNNNGIGWSPLGAAQGLNDINSLSLTMSGTDLYVFTDHNSPYKSTDSGTSFSTVTPTPGAYFDGMIKSDGTGNVYLHDNYYSKLWKSTNGGTTWTSTFPSNPQNTYGRCNAIYFSSATTLYMAYTSGIFKSTDSGATASLANEGLTGVQSTQIMITDNGRLLIAAPYTFSQGFQISIDDGQSWALQKTGAMQRQIYGFVKNGSTIIGYGSGVIKTTDNASTWTQLNASEYLPKVVLSGTTLFGWSANYVSGAYTYAIKKSVDGGATWTPTTITGLPTSSSSYVINNQFFVDDTGNSYVIVYTSTNPTNTRFEVYKINANSSAATKLTIPANTSISDIECFNGKVYMSGYFNNVSAIVVSSDGGATWPTTLTTPTSGTFRVINDNTLFLLGQKLYVSTDAGLSWADNGIFSAVVNGYNSVTDVAISATNYAYLSLNYAPAFKSNNQIIPPTPPSTLAVAGFSHSRVTLKWTDNSSNEDYFIVERSTDDVKYDSVGTVLKNTFITSGEMFINTALTAQTTYYFKVRAVNAAGKSAYSNKVSATTLQNCLSSSAIPTNRSWTGTTLNESGIGIKTDVLVSITSNGSAGFYGIDKLTVGAATGIHSEPAVANIIENCGNVFIQSGNEISNGNGTWNSITKTLTVHWQTRPNFTYRAETTVFTLNANDPIPASPTSLTSYIVNTTSLAVGWTGTNYSSEYIVQRSLTTGSGFAEIGRVAYPGNSYVDVNVTSGTKYYYRVLGSNSSGASAPSAESSVTMQLPFFNAVSVVPASTTSKAIYGSAWADLDSDGFEDLIFVYIAADQPVKTLRNKGDGTFEDVAFTNLADNTNIHGGVAVGDYNGDGKVDLLTTGGGTEPARIWTNNGGNSFTSTDLLTFTGTGYTPAFVDFNKDGLLDASFSIYNGTTATGFQIFQQQPDHSFVKYDLGEVASDKGKSLSSSWADFDNDNDLDLLVEEYEATANRFYENQGSGTFTKKSITAFTTDAAMYHESSSWGDFDNDGDLDLFQGNSGPDGATLGDMLYQNNGDGTFTRLTTSLPAEILPNTYYTNGSSWGDVDNDGDLDLFVARGPNSALYLNSGTGTFTKYAVAEYLNSGNSYDNGGSFCDFNKDGFLDLFIQRQSAQALPVLQNTKNTGKWIQFKLIGTTSNRDAIGARVTLHLASSKIQIREVSPLSGFEASDSRIVHFGLGSLTTIPSVDIRWPSGIVQTLTNVTSNQILSITEDGAGPAITTFSPAKDATGVATSTTIAITVDESSTAIAGKKIYLYKSSDLTTPVASADVTTATKTGNEYKFTLPNKLLLNTQYTVAIDAGAVKDVYGNLSLALNTNIWTFTTSPGPVPSALSPARDAIGIDANSTLSLTFGGPVTLVAAKTLKIYKSSDLVNAVESINITAGVVSGNVVTFTKTKKFQRATAYTIGIDAGAFVDIDGNDSPVMNTTGALAWSFTSAGGPSTVTLAPANAATNVAVNTAIEVTFDKAVTAVAGKKIKVMNGATAVLDVDVSTTGTISGNKYNVPAPTGNWPNLATLSVTIDAGAFVDANQNDFAGIATGWSFTTVEAPDVIAPVIAFDPLLVPATLEKSFPTFSLAVPITDNKTVASATFFHRKVSEKNFTATAMSLNNALGKWETQITNSFTDEMGFEYYFEALDNATPSANKGRFPAGSAYLRVTTSFANSAPNFSIPGGATKTSWKIVSVPYALPNNNNSVENIFGFGAVDKSQWRVIRYAPTPAWVDVSTIDRGKGYFVNAVSSKSITLVNASAPSFTRDNLFSLNLDAGFNQIGNPYTLPISWDDIKNFNPGLTGSLLSYNGGYVAVTTLNPFEGGFVNVTTAMTIKIPFPGQPAGSGKKGFGDLGHNIDAEEWTLPINLKQGEITYEFAAVGMAKDASLAADDFDDMTPPRFFDYLEMNFARENFSKRIARDIVPSKDNFSWDFSLASNQSGTVEMYWNNEPLAQSVNEIYLLDISRQTLIDMRQRGSYSFNAKESSQFKIYYGKDLHIAPVRTAFGNAYPNPTSGITNIGFSLPESNGLRQSVSVELIDNTGRTLETVIQGEYRPGYHEAIIDARQMSSGFYTLRLNVSGTEGKIIQVKKLVVK